MEKLTDQNGQETNVSIVERDPVVKMPTVQEIEERKKAIKKLDDIDEKKCTQVVCQYWSPKSDDEIRGIFAGWRVMQVDNKRTGEKENRPAVLIDTKNGGRLLAQIQVVDSFLGNIPENSSVYVKCLSSKQGEMYTFDVRVLEYPK